MTLNFDDMNKISGLDYARPNFEDVGDSFNCPLQEFDGDDEDLVWGDVTEVSDLESVNVLTDVEREMMGILFESDYPEYVKECVKKHMSYVYALVMKEWVPNTPHNKHEDLKQEAMVALVKAVQGFNPNSERAKIETYIYRVVRNHLIDFIYKSKDILGRKKPKNSKDNKVKRMIEDGYPEEEIAKILNMTLDKVYECMERLEAIIEVVSLDKEVYDGVSMHDMLTEFAEDNYFETTSIETGGVLERGIKELTEGERLVIQLYLGIEGGEVEGLIEGLPVESFGNDGYSITLNRVGEILSLSKRQVEIRYHKARTKLLGFIGRSYSSSEKEDLWKQRSQEILGLLKR